MFKITKFLKITIINILKNLEENFINIEEMGNRGEIQCYEKKPNENPMIKICNI